MPARLRQARRARPRARRGWRRQARACVSASWSPDGAQHCGDQAGCPESVPRSNAHCSEPAAEPQHRERERHAVRVLEIAGVDRLVLDRGDGRGEAAELRQAAEQRRRELGRAGEDDVAERVRVGIEPEAGAVARDPAHRRAEADLAPARGHERRRRRRKERAEIGFGSSRSLAARPPPSVSRSTFANTRAEARSGGVLSADTQSGTHNRSRRAPVWPCRARSRSTLSSGVEREPRRGGGPPRSAPPRTARPRSARTPETSPASRCSGRRQRRCPQPEAGGVAQLERQTARAGARGRRRRAASAAASRCRRRSGCAGRCRGPRRRASRAARGRRGCARLRRP